MTKRPGVLRRAGMGLAAVLMATSGVAVSTGTAAAATPLCEKMVARAVQGATVEVPASDKGHPTCHLSRSQAANRTIVLRFQLTMIKCYGGLRLASPYQDEKIQDLDADGDFGPRTEAALEAVQDNIGVTVDGSYGPVTRDHMRFVNVNGRTCHRYS